MTLHRLTTTRTLAGAVAGLALLGSGVPTAVQAAGNDTTTGLTNTQLTRMRDEERMARDLYTQLAASSGETLFARIARSEQRHLGAVERLMASQGMNLHAAGSTVGRYAEADLQSAYSAWLAQGRASDQAAYKVGVELEKQDIADLKGLTVRSGTAGARVVTALLAGSEHHLTAFTKAVNGDVPAIGPGMGMGSGGRGNVNGGTCPYRDEQGPGRQGDGPGMGQGRGMGWSG